MGIVVIQRGLNLSLFSFLLLTIFFTWQVSSKQPASQSTSKPQLGSGEVFGVLDDGLDKAVTYFQGTDPLGGLGGGTRDVTGITVMIGQKYQCYFFVTPATTIVSDPRKGTGALQKGVRVNVAYRKLAASEQDKGYFFTGDAIRITVLSDPLQPMSQATFGFKVHKPDSKSWYTEVDPNDGGPFLHWNLNSSRYPDHKIPYYINAKGVSNLKLSEVKKAIERAFGSWKAASNGAIDFKFVDYINNPVPSFDQIVQKIAGGNITSLKDGKNVISWDEGANVDALGITYPVDFDANTGELFEVDILFNGGIQKRHDAQKKNSPKDIPIRWGVGNSQGEQNPIPIPIVQSNYFLLDVQDQASHEIGHFLGIGHSSTRGDAMHQGANGITHREIKSNDRAAINFLYGRKQDLVNSNPGIVIEPGLYKLTNRFLGGGRSLEAASNGDSNPFMGGSGNNRRQTWQIVPAYDGWYLLINHFSAGALDTYSDGENQPFVGQIGNYSGQLWHITSLGDGWYRLTNQYLGDGKSLDTYANGDNKLFMGKTGYFTGQYWKLTRLQSPEISGQGLDGKWYGKWSHNNGDAFDCEMTLSVSGDNAISGSITWFLKKTLRPELQSKIGLSAIEYVRGNYDPNISVVSFEGYNKHDPNQIISLDKYKLSISNNNTKLNGETYAYGDWGGRFSASRN